MPGPLRLLARGWGALDPSERGALAILTSIAVAVIGVVAGTALVRGWERWTLMAGGSLTDSVPSAGADLGNAGLAVGMLVGISLVLLLYFVPSVVANARSHRNTAAIVTLNILLGWTLLGWIIALIWALTYPRPLVEQRSVATVRGSFCSACGRSIPDGAKFCPGCGDPVAPLIDRPDDTRTTSPAQGGGGGAMPSPTRIAGRIWGSLGPWPKIAVGVFLIAYLAWLAIGPGGRKERSSAGDQGAGVATEAERAVAHHAQEQTAKDSLIAQLAQPLINKCIEEGAISRITYSSMTEAVVLPRFYLLEYQGKLGVAGAISSVAKSMGYNGSVRFVDAYSNKKVGIFNGYVNLLDWTGE